MLCRRGRLLLLALIRENVGFATTTISTDALPYHLVWHGGPAARAASERIACANVARRPPGRARLAALNATWRTTRPFPRPWHATTQESLFKHLRRLWHDDCYRVFVDLGSAAGAGPFQNTSDGLIWLTYFNHSGHVFSLDLEEDFAIDLAERFRNAAPFNAATRIALDVVVAALSAGNSGLVTTGSGPSGKQCLKAKSYWDAKEAQQLMTHGEADHFCRVPRWRAGYGDARVRARWPNFPPPAPELRVDGAYIVKSLTMDDIWSEGLLRAHVDFLKIDVDLKWDRIDGGFRDIVNASAWLAIFARLLSKYLLGPRGIVNRSESRCSKMFEKLKVEGARTRVFRRRFFFCVGLLARLLRSLLRGRPCCHWLRRRYGIHSRC